MKLNIKGYIRQAVNEASKPNPNKVEIDRCLQAIKEKIAQYQGEFSYLGHTVKDGKISEWLFNDIWIQILDGSKNGDMVLWNGKPYNVLESFADKKQAKEFTKKGNEKKPMFGWLKLEYIMIECPNSYKVIGR